MRRTCKRVELVERLPLLLGAVQERLGRGPKIPHVVDQDVQARIINGQCGFRHSRHHVAVADVADDNRARSAGRVDLIAGCSGRVRIDVGQHHVRARSGQAPADATADAQRPSGHHSDLVREPRSHLFSLFG
jgi:hypothetical protein